MLKRLWTRRPSLISEQSKSLWPKYLRPQYYENRLSKWNLLRLWRNLCTKPHPYQEDFFLCSSLFLYQSAFKPSLHARLFGGTAAIIEDQYALIFVQLLYFYRICGSNKLYLTNVYLASFLVNDSSEKYYAEVWCRLSGLLYRIRKRHIPICEDFHCNSCLPGKLADILLAALLDGLCVRDRAAVYLYAQQGFWK